MLQLPPLQNTGPMGEIPPASLLAPINLLIFNSHTLAHLSIIQLHHSLANEIPDSYDNCLASARDILQLALTLSPEDYPRMAMEVILSVRLIFRSRVPDLKSHFSTHGQSRLRYSFDINEAWQQPLGLRSLLRSLPKWNQSLAVLKTFVRHTQ